MGLVMENSGGIEKNVKLFRQMEIFSSASDWHLRHNPNPVGWTAVPQLALVLVVLHETLAGRMMIDYRDVLLLIWSQHGDIDLDECFVFPQRARISSVQTHFDRYWLLD